MRDSTTPLCPVVSLPDMQCPYENCALRSIGMSRVLYSNKDPVRCASVYCVVVGLDGRGCGGLLSCGVAGAAIVQWEGWAFGRRDFFPGGSADEVWPVGGSIEGEGGGSMLLASSAAASELDWWSLVALTPLVWSALSFAEGRTQVVLNDKGFFLRRDVDIEDTREMV